MLEEDNKAAETEMRHREITLGDGRYMIFYTFGAGNDRDVEEHSEEIEQGEDVRTSL